MESMSPTEAIASAIDSFSAKVSELREAYNELETNSPSIASSLRWGDLEAYISAAEKSITERFRSLESKAKRVQLSAPPDSAANLGNPAEQETIRPEIKDLCVNVDPNGMRAFLHEHSNERTALQFELAAALRLVPNPARFVLDVVEGVKPRTKELRLRTGIPCMIILVALRIASLEIGPEEKQRAKSLAMEFKNVTSKNELRKISWFLLLVGAFKLISEFDVDEILDLIVLGANKKLTLRNSKFAGIDDQYPALIHKFMKKNMHIVAVRYICALGLEQKIDPVHILEDHIKQSKHVAAEILKKNAHAEKQARQVQVHAIREVMGVINQNMLVCHLTMESLGKQINEIRRSDECGIPVAKVVQQRQTEQANKRPRLSHLPAANLAAHCPLPSLPTQTPLLSPISAYKNNLNAPHNYERN